MMSSGPAERRRRWHPLNQIAVAVVFFLVAGTLAAAFVSSAGKNFTLDETEIALRAHFINIKGPETFLDGSHYLAHPPLYEYTVALIFRLFGEREVPVRVFGALIYLLIGWLLVLLVRELLTGHSAFVRRLAAGVALMLYGANPLLIQHGMLVDADTTGTALFLMLFGYLFVRWECRPQTPFVRSRMALGVVFALIFLSKEVTPCLVVPVMLGYRLVNRQWKKLFLEAAWTFGFGLALAWGLWWIYCALTGTDVMVFVKYTLIKKIKRVMDPAYLTRVADGFARILRWPLYWTSAPFFAWLGWTVLTRGWNFLRKGKTAPVDACWWLALGIWVPYLFVKPTIDMMKYQHPVYPLFIAAMVVLVMRMDGAREAALKDFLRNNFWLLPVLAVTLCCLVGYYYRLGDYLLIMWEPATAGVWRRFLNDYYRPLAAALLVVLMVPLFRKAGFRVALAVGCFLCLLPINTALSWHQTAPYTTAESWMNYGESGLKDAAVYIAGNASDGASVSARVDMKYYLNVHYRADRPLEATKDIRSVMLTKDLKVLTLFFYRTRLEYVVFDKIALMGMPPDRIQEGLTRFARFYFLDRRFGSFKVYKLRDKPVL